jgi:tetratricopeptide (TPR) repeat protein
MMKFFTFLFFFLIQITAFAAPVDPIHSDAEFDSTVIRANKLYLNADFDSGISIISQLQKSRPDDPAVSYFLANGYWWKIFRAHVYDKETTETPYDDKFDTYLQETIARSEALLRRNAKDVKALFYLGNAYSLKSRMKGLRGSYFSAGRDAGKGKSYLEDVLKIEPNQSDTLYNLGVYNYLADTLPGYAKVLKTLLFLPGGNKETGLKYLTTASKKSLYFGAEAELVLAQFYADFEDRPQDAVQIVERFHVQYPRNAWYHYWLGTLILDELHDYDRAESIYAEILDRCRRKLPSYTTELQNQARLKMARVKSRQLYPEKAIADIRELISEKPNEPGWILSRAYLELGNIYDQIGMRKEAMVSYSQVLSLRDYRNFHEEANKLRTEKYNQTEANIYRMNLEGRRLAADGQFAEAEASFRQVLKKYPNNNLTNYYMAELLLMKGAYPQAEKQFNKLLERKPKEPKWLVAGIYVKLGRVYEARKQAVAARRSYEKALDAEFIASNDRNAAKQRLRQIARSKILK